MPSTIDGVLPMVAFEGLDGAGKSTQIHMLADALRTRGLEVEVLRLNANPLFKQVCRFLNEDELIDSTRAALMKASELSGRLESCVIPQVERGTVVLWDKYVAGSLAADFARGVSEVCLQALNMALPKPALTVYLDITPAEAVRRKRLAGGPRPMESGLDLYLNVSVRDAFAMLHRGELSPQTIDEAFRVFQTRVRAGYDAYLPSHTTARLNATDPVSELTATIWAKAASVLGVSA